MEARTRYLASVPGPALKRGFQRKVRPLFGARAFPRRRTSCGARRGGGWNAVRLQWRRAAQRLAPASQAAPGGGLAFHSWLTCLQLHLTNMWASPRAAAWRDKGQAPSGMAAWALPQNSSTARLRGYVGGPRQPAHLRVFRARIAPRPVEPAASSALARVQRAMPLMAVRRAAPSAITNTVRRSAPLPGAGTPFSGMRVAVAAQTGNNNPMLFSATKAARGANGPGNRATSARSPAAPLSGAAIWHRPTPELVWPKQAGMQAADAREPYKLAGHAGGPGIDSGTSRQATSAARAAQAAPPAGAIAAQLRDGPLDAVLADRLATEVIRRVERSMRIERERRGY